MEAWKTKVNKYEVGMSPCDIKNRVITQGQSQKMRVTVKQTRDDIFLLKTKLHRTGSVHVSLIMQACDLAQLYF